MPILEERVDDSPINSRNNEQIEISYSFAEEQFLQQQAAVAYAPVNYSEDNNHFSFNSQDDYWVTPIPQAEAETVTTEEAEVMVQNIQYAAVLGSAADLDHTERRKFATWTFFNTAYLNLFHTLHALTGEVNYSKTF